MGGSRPSKPEVGEEEVAENDRVFVPHYEDYAHTVESSLAAESARKAKKQTSFPQESPPSVLPPSGSHQFWASSAEGSSMSSVDNYDPAASVSLHQRLSEFQVALRASERAREEGQRETDSLRVYVGNVEAAAAGLLSRVQELEHLLALSSVVKQGHDIDQLRGKVATAATREVQKHAAAAAQAVAAAREATMELDKVRRETHALTRAQQEEIERLNVEAAECRILHEARARQNQDLLDQNDRLERELEEKTTKFEEMHQLHAVEYAAVQKKYENVMATARESRAQTVELKKALDLSKSTARTLQKKVDDLLLETKESLLAHELLEQQVKSLQGQEVSSTIAHYDQELRKVRASLGGEKAQLLIELGLVKSLPDIMKAALRRSNQTLRGEVADWQEKFKFLSQQFSGLEELSGHTEQSSNRKLGTKLRDSHRASKSGPSSCNTILKPESSHSAKKEEGEERKQVVSSASSSASVAGPISSYKDTDSTFTRSDKKVEDIWSRGSSGPNSTKALQHSPTEQSLSGSHGANGIFALTGFDQRKQQFRNVRKAKSRENSGIEVDGTGESCLTVNHKNVVAASHRDTLKSKEESGGEQKRALQAAGWPVNVEPLGVFGPVMMFLIGLLALGVSVSLTSSSQILVRYFESSKDT